LIRVARSAIASLYGLDSITDYDEHRHTLEHLLDNNTYMLRAVDRSLTADVRYLHLSRRGLCLADHVLSQRSPSPQSVASVRVCCLSCHVFAIANRRFSQRSASRGRLRLFRCATSPAMSLPSLTVVFHSHRCLRILPSRHIWLCRRGC
jgi:hypothetical protein